jgi:biotin-dependent carboxylase-like uncharacterized protein
MSAVLTLLRAGPLTTIQDDGRFGMLQHGISASGPMDRVAFAQAGDLAGSGHGGVEFTLAGLELRLASGTCRVGMAGGDFTAHHNGQPLAWPGMVTLEAGDTLAVTPGRWGNYGYLRFGADLAVPAMMGSMSTNSRAGLGGLAGRALRAGDVIELTRAGRTPLPAAPAEPEEGPIRFVWGLHAERFSTSVRQRFIETGFVVSPRLDRMGVRLDDKDGVFAGATILSLVSDAVVPGDIQILGDGSPIVLMRDHQPTGGYPRIATVISADLDRFAQLRPGSAVSFAPVTVDHAHRLLRSHSR